jgi:Sulfotransferase family
VDDRQIGTGGGATGGRAEPDVFPIVVGCVRSGTTMLRAMLDSHSALAVPPESYFVAMAVALADRYETANGVDQEALLRAVVQDPSFGEWQIPVAEVRELWRESQPADVPAALTDLYARYALGRDKARYGDKTPANVLYVELLAGAFPTGRFLHIVRDGRDVVPSLMEMHFGPDRFGAAALFWRDRVSRGRAGGQRIGADRYREIRYEDLVADPEPVLRGVCEFFELTYEPSMLRYHERADELLDGLRFTHHVQGIRRPPARDVRDWRANLPDHEVQLFGALAGDLLDELGYERSGMAVSSRARVEATAWRAGTTMERRTRTLRTRVTRRLPNLPFGSPKGSDAPAGVRA